MSVPLIEDGLEQLDYIKITNGGTVYHCYSNVGTLQSESRWGIKRVVASTFDGLTTSNERWAKRPSSPEKAIMSFRLSDIHNNSLFTD